MCSVDQMKSQGRATHYLSLDEYLSRQYWDRNEAEGTSHEPNISNNETAQTNTSIGDKLPKAYQEISCTNLTKGTQSASETKPLQHISIPSHMCFWERAANHRSSPQRAMKHYTEMTMSCNDPKAVIICKGRRTCV